jgi:hypothetical protein
MLMALTVTVNKYASSNVQAVHNRKQANSTLRSTTNMEFGRRGLVLSTVIAATATQDPESRILLLQSIYA